MVHFGWCFICTFYLHVYVSFFAGFTILHFEQCGHISCNSDIVYMFVCERDISRNTHKWKNCHSTWIIKSSHNNSSNRKKSKVIEKKNRGLARVKKRTVQETMNFVNLFRFMAFYNNKGRIYFFPFAFCKDLHFLVRGRRI